jgi:peptidoglycan hydrolase-like protein with peptidoglycan-binding domain
VPTSQNGYPANDRSLVSSRTIPGTQVKVTVRNGAAGDLLLYAASRWDKEVEDIDNARGALDDWGYAERPIRGGTELSNHASGTAIDLNATQHPLATAPIKTFTTEQIRAVRRIMADCGGALRWGGDYSGRPDSMHIEVIAPEKRCAQVLLRLTALPAASWPTIRRGDTGTAVGVIQRFLGVKPVSEFFGDLTEAAVRKYQAMRGLEVDGVVGAATWRETGL